MSVLIDNSSTAKTASGTSLTWNHNCNGGVLIVNIRYGDFHAGTINSVTFNGVTMTAMSGTAQSFTGINLEMISYILIAPSAGTHAVVINANYGVPIIGFATSFNNTDGSLYRSDINVLSDAEFGTATNNSGSYQFAALQGQLLFTFIAFNSGATPLAGSQVLLQSNNIGSSYGAAIAYTVAPSDGQMTYAYSSLGGTGFVDLGFVLDFVAGPSSSSGSILLLGVG